MKELNTSIKYSIIEYSNIDNFSTKDIKLCHNTIIKELNKKGYF